MEVEPFVPFEPGTDLGMFVRRIVVGDGVDQFARRDTGLDGVEEPNDHNGPKNSVAVPNAAANQTIMAAEVAVHEDASGLTLTLASLV